MIGSKFSRHFVNQSEVKPKPIVAGAFTFPRTLCRLRVINSSFDWFTGLSPSFLIGQSSYFGFGFTTLSRKPLYQSIDDFITSNYPNGITNRFLLLFSSHPSLLFVFHLSQQFATVSYFTADNSDLEIGGRGRLRARIFRSEHVHFNK